jgi:sialate O-acetylesterase
MPVPVWGITDPGEKVLVILDRQKKTAVAVFDGRWMVKLGKMASGEPFTMTIAGKNTVSTLRPADRM